MSYSVSFRIFWGQVLPKGVFFYACPRYSPTCTLTITADRWLLTAIFWYRGHRISPLNSLWRINANETSACGACQRAFGEKWK